MLAGQAIGATLGSRLVITKGTKIIKPLVVTMSLAMSFKLLASQYNFFRKLFDIKHFIKLTHQ